MTGLRGRTRWLAAALGAAALFALAVAAPALAGQIVYTHGNDLWVMNDNGTGQRELVSDAQVGGAITTFSGDTGVGVEPNGTGIAFDASVPPAGLAACGNRAEHCPGIYSLIDGKVVRLTPAPATCSAGTFCGGEELDPSVTSTGQVVYYSLAVVSQPDCGIYYCGYFGGVQEQYYTVPLSGTQAPTAWPTPAEQNGSYPNGAEPGFEGPIASDPADPTKIAYGGTYLTGVDSLDGDGCGADGHSDCYPIDVESSSGAYNQPAIDDGFYDGFAFSPDGTRIADIETGDNKGIWVYPSAQTWGTVGSGNPSATYTWAVEDPDNVSGAGESDQVINGLTWTSSGIVVSADYNLWLIPPRCWATPANPSSPAANCHFPSDAAQLTHDGTSSTPDADPSWTSSTAQISAYGSGNGGNGGNGGKGGATTPNTKLAGKQINTKHRKATFKFKAVGSALRFQCALIRRKKGHKQPKPKFSSCKSPKTYARLKHGSYVFEVRSVGTAGPDKTPATAKFSI